MSGTINISMTMQVSNGLLNDQFVSDPQQIDETNIGVVGGTHLMSTSDSLIPELTGLTNAGWCILQNLDDTNYIVWGPDNGSGTMIPVGKLKPGEYAMLRLIPSLDGVVNTCLRAQANTASVLLFVRIYED